MTLANRERAYKHFRDLEKNYEAPEGMNHSCTSTTYVRQRGKALADRLLLKNPELKDCMAPKAEMPAEPPKPTEKELKENDKYVKEKENAEKNDKKKVGEADKKQPSKAAEVV